MSILKLHWLIDRKVNRLNTNHNNSVLTPAIKDDLINEATLMLIERHAFRSRAQIGFEVTTQIIDMFGNLLIKEEKIVPTLVKEGLYEVKLNNLKHRYLHLARAFANSEDCANNKIILKQHDDLQYSLGDSFQQPSKKWRRILGTFGKTSTLNSAELSLYLYVDSDVILKEVFLDYVRLPKKVFEGSYDTLEYLECKKNTPTSECKEFKNKSDSTVDSEIDEKYHYLLGDIVVELFGRDFEHFGKVQSSITKQDSLT